MACFDSSQSQSHWEPGATPFPPLSPQRIACRRRGKEQSSIVLFWPSMSGPPGINIICLGGKLAERQLRVRAAEDEREAVMFGFGFIVSLISFSLSSAHFPPPPHPKQAIKQEASAGRGALPGRNKRDVLQHAPWVALSPAPDEQRRAFRGFVQAAGRVAHLAWHGSPSHADILYPSVLYSLASTAWAAALSVSLGNWTPDTPGSPHLLNSCTPFTRCTPVTRKLHDSPK